MRTRPAGLLILGALAGLGGARQDTSHRPVRILLGTVASETPISVASATWSLVDDARRTVSTGAATDRWSVQRDGRRLRAVRGDAPASGWSSASLTLEPGGDGTVTWNGKAYRGALTFAANDSAILVVNRVDVEEYLRGVLPLEIGARLTEDHAAVEAQAVAARSFTITRMLSSGTRPFDLRADESDQVYGGTSAETFWGDLAVAATAGWVLSAGGRVVSGPYHSACGGSTALPSEVWRGGQDGFLRSVDDTDPRTGRPWCDIAPRVAWERRVTATDLLTRIARLGGSAAAARSIRDARVDGRSASGRVRALVVATERGDVTVPASDIRSILRAPGGDLLPSTAFEISVGRLGDGTVRELVLRGRGNGHGVGLCQWGAIARARAGADFRAILKAYYPGAVLSRAP